MSDLRRYTASFIFDMRGCTSTVDAIVEKLSGIISSLGGQTSSIKNLGQKNFERVANRKFSSGIYIQISFEGKSNIVSEMKSKLRLDNTINRILVEADR
ncbi:MAG: 30S ribosomal protein S6 [Puniceicoccales bacterium]|jgi:small subunit ribosomal protein S6|nr:30S ribosomal protein S6 [Puniceicoccales bacterium]